MLRFGRVIKEKPLLSMMNFRNSVSTTWWRIWLVIFIASSSIKAVGGSKVKNTNWAYWIENFPLIFLFF